MKKVIVVVASLVAIVTTVGLVFGREQFKFWENR